MNDIKNRGQLVPVDRMTWHALRHKRRCVFAQYEPGALANDDKARMQMSHTTDLFFLDKFYLEFMLAALFIGGQNSSFNISYSLLQTDRNS